MSEIPPGALACALAPRPPFIGTVAPNGAKSEVAHSTWCCGAAGREISKAPQRPSLGRETVNLELLRVRLAEVHAEHLDRGCVLKPKLSIETSNTTVTYCRTSSVSYHKVLGSWDNKNIAIPNKSAKQYLP
ncbi:hypothetical protein L484_001273 [Morus notabilis]|uniref:Uncharacterized protein n=1 Tax=Morus notabilis TaxID=981085 RepID=W9R8Y5_9ROSA|nr:hypothetical protein L484_001273 [Morus notabilis]